MKKYSRKSQTASKRRPDVKLLAIIAVIVLALGLGSVFAYSRINNNKEPNTTVAVPEDDVNYDPPTDVEQSAGDRQKEEIIRNQQAKKDKDNQTPSNNPPTGNNQASGNKKKVTPSITSWEKTNGNIVFRGIVPVIENSGTCTISLEKDGQKVTGKSEATKDSQHMNCIVNVQASKISGDGWKAKLIYSSDRYRGESEVEPYSL